MYTRTLSEGGFNDLARQFDHLGTFGIRFETLRAVAMDLGGSIARKGFRHIWVLHFHGMPFHKIALTQAAAFVNQRYKARMVNITMRPLIVKDFEELGAAKPAGLDPSERHAIPASAADIAAVFSRDTPAAGWAKDGALTRYILLFWKGDVMVGVLIDRNGKTFTLMGSSPSRGRDSIPQQWRFRAL